MLRTLIGMHPLIIPIYSGYRNGSFLGCLPIPRLRWPWRPLIGLRRCRDELFLCLSVARRNGFVFASDRRSHNAGGTLREPCIFVHRWLDVLVCVFMFESCSSE
jgi:hypothetical protein